MVAKHNPERNVCHLGRGTVIPSTLPTRAYFHHLMAVIKMGIAKAVGIRVEGSSTNPET
jgi:hypothetical protein